MGHLLSYWYSVAQRNCSGSVTKRQRLPSGIDEEETEKVKHIV